MAMGCGSSLGVVSPAMVVTSLSSGNAVPVEDDAGSGVAVPVCGGVLPTLCGVGDAVVTDRSSGCSYVVGA